MYMMFCVCLVRVVLSRGLTLWDDSSGYCQKVRWKRANNLTFLFFSISYLNALSGPKTSVRNAERERENPLKNILRHKLLHQRDLIRWFFIVLVYVDVVCWWGDDGDDDDDGALLIIICRRKSFKFCHRKFEMWEQHISLSEDFGPHRDIGYVK